MAKKFKMRSEPKKPERYTWLQDCHLEDGMTIAEIKKRIKSYPYNYTGKVEDIKIRLKDDSYDYYDNSQYLIAEIPKQHTDEQHAEVLKHYEETLAAYKKWAKDNEKEIKEEVERRDKILKEKQKRAKLKEQRRDEHELKRLQKKLKKMKEDGD